MLSTYLQATNVSLEQFGVGVSIIVGILLLSYFVTKYTKYGGGSNWGGNGDIDDDWSDPFD